MICVAALALAGCAPMQWVKPDGTPEQFAQDSAVCRQEAVREARGRFWFSRPAAPILARDAAGRRFFVSPFGRFAGPFDDPFFEENRLENFCMRAKGYALVEKPKQPAEQPKEQAEPKS